MSHLPAIPAATALPTLAAGASPVANLARAARSFAAPAYAFANPSGNLSEAARPVYQALQAAIALPPSATPEFILPAGGSFLRLFTAVQAVAAERIYPAPIFSFSA